MKETTHHEDFCKQSSQQHIVTALCAEKYETETEEAENESYVKHSSISAFYIYIQCLLIKHYLFLLENNTIIFNFLWSNKRNRKPPTCVYFSGDDRIRFPVLFSGPCFKILNFFLVFSASRLYVLFYFLTESS